MDTVPREVRSRIMRANKGSGTRLETLVRSAARKLGLRPMLNVRALPGTPDLVLKAQRIAIFVHGCFWHGHSCRELPTTRRAFWKSKFEVNQARDLRISRELRAMGWRVIIIRECELK
jgi:DNA mismatch endonuclease, patch repair protein